MSVLVLDCKRNCAEHSEKNGLIYRHCTGNSYDCDYNHGHLRGDNNGDRCCPTEAAMSC